MELVDAVMQIIIVVISVIAGYVIGHDHAEFKVRRRPQTLTGEQFQILYDALVNGEDDDEWE